MSRLERSGRSAYSLIEVLVVVSLLAILTAFTLAATQKVRAAAARAACSNNLRQVALALQSYHDAHRHLPPGDAYRGNHGTWQVAVLPYLEQEALFRVYENFGGPATSGPLHPSYQSGMNLKVTTTRLAVLTCPADTPNAVRLAGPGGEHRLTAHNYAVNFGNTNRRRDNLPGADFAGAPFVWGGKTHRMSDLTDGASVTLFAAEVRQGRGQDMRGLSWWGPATSLTTYNPPNTPEPDQFQFIEHCGFPDQPTDPDMPCEADGAVLISSRSVHGTGVNITLGDGSQRYVRNTIAPEVWRALGSSQGGEPGGLE